MAKKSRPSETTFRILYHKVASVLIFFGVWPTDHSQIRSIILTFLLAFIPVLFLIENIFDFWTEGKSFNDAYTHTNGTIMSMAYMFMILFRREFFYTIMNRIGDDLVRKQNSVEEMHTILAGHELSRTLKIATIITMATGSMKFIQPFVTIFLYYIFTGQTNYFIPPPMALPLFFGPIFTYILESAYTSMLLSMVIAYMIVFMMFTIHICSALNAIGELILVEKSPTIEVPPGEKFLIDCIQRHNYLIDLVNDFGKIFGPVLFIDCIFSTLNICSVMYSITQNVGSVEHVFNQMAILSFGVSQLFLICWYSGRLVIASVELSDMAYNSNWFRMSNTHKTRILFLISRNQKPVTLNLLWNFTPTLELFLGMCSRAYGYYNMMRSI